VPHDRLDIARELILVRDENTIRGLYFSHHWRLRGRPVDRRRHPDRRAFDDMPIGALPAGTGKTMRFTGTSILKVVDGMITEEIGLDDGVTVLQQLGLIAA
jgi:hypothetical protein